MHIYAIMAINGKPTLTSDSRGGGLFIDVNLSPIKRYFLDFLMKKFHFYCSIGCAYLLQNYLAKLHLQN